MSTGWTSLNVRYIVPVDDRLPPLLLLRPPGLPPGAPVAVCVHGYTRQPLDQLQAFAAQPAAEGMALVLPLFGERGHRRYQQLRHPRRGTRSDLALLEVLDSLATSDALDVRRLYLFGYSGGAQFTHRFALLHPQRTAALAVGAAGWYTWPDAAHAWPQGLGDTMATLGSHIDIDAFLRLPIRLWVGERDVTVDRYVRDDAGVTALQGTGRMERAQRWLAAVQATAARRGVAARIDLQVLPGVGHDFGACDRKAALARKVMEFFASHRPVRTTGAQRMLAGALS